MYTKPKKQSKLAIIGDNIVNLSTMDKDDLSIIMQNEGFIPLSKDERDYLEQLHYKFSINIDIMKKVALILSDEDSNAHITSILNDAVGDSINLLDVGIDDIGRGYVITKEEILDEKER